MSSEPALPSITSLNVTLCFKRRFLSISVIIIHDLVSVSWARTPAIVLAPSVSASVTLNAGFFGSILNLLALRSTPPTYVSRNILRTFLF